MLLFINLKNKSVELVSNKLHKGILIRTALLSWSLIIIILSIFILGIIPAQREALEERMKTEAKDIANSIGQVTATAIINKDYGFTVDYCLKMIKQSNSILYVVITRKDGFSLVQTKNGWRQETIKSSPYFSVTNETLTKFLYSDLVKQDVFHYSYPFTYSGINWGRINIGLSVKGFNQNMNNLYYRIIWLTVLSIMAGLFISVYFAKKLTNPIRQLDNLAQKISGGKLDVRVNIKSEDEIGRLARSFNKMAESLKSSQDNLERKVEERTAELENINRMMQMEIKERLLVENRLKQYNSRLEVFDKIYRGIISAKSVNEIIKETIVQLPILGNYISTAAVATRDIKENKVDVQVYKANKKDNEGFANLTLPLDINFDNSEDSPANNIKMVNDIRLLEKQDQMEREMLKDGLVSYISVPLIMEQEKLGSLSIASEKPDVFSNQHIETLLYFSHQLAVAIYQAQLQAKIRTHAENLQNSLSEKEVLLKEIHHRVKNNLQVISSLLYLNSKKSRDKETLEMFKDSQNRVKSIALVHERLYQSRDLGKIDFEEYVRKLILDLSRSYGVNQDLIKINIDITNIIISIDEAVPCGLIINELVSNSLKYAFPKSTGKENTINIRFKKIGGRELLLIVSDNGIGISEDLNEKKKNSLGIQLVETLVEQLDGKLEIDLSSGTAYNIKFEGTSV